MSMLLIRCTQKLLKGSKTPLDPDPPRVDGLLSEWFANRVPLPFPGRNAVMYTSAGTLLTVVTFGNVLRTTLPVFIERTPALLRRVGVSDEWIREQTVGFENVRFARTDNRRVLGSMTDLADLLWHYAARWRSFEQIDADWLELRLAETPMSFLGMDSPHRLVTKLARGVAPDGG
jgi:uncharacterized protein DUF6933